MAELVDALDLKSNEYLNARAGSTPAGGTLDYTKASYFTIRGFFYLIGGLFYRWTLTVLSSGLVIQLSNGSLSHWFTGSLSH